MPHTHSASLGGVEVPVTFNPAEASGLMQEMGIVGCGGAGFPTYVKYEQPPNALIVNLAESEPGYYADKLLARDEPEALVDVFDWLDQTFGIQVVLVGAEDVAKPYLTELEDLADDLENFSIGYFDPKYKYGQERALCKIMLGMDIPASDLPSDHGVVVNNIETLWNVYKACFTAEPMTSKYLHFYGEVQPLTVYEAPIGTLACDLFETHGSNPAAYAHHQLFDGGPILSEKVADPLGEEPRTPVRRNTNAFLVVDPDLDEPKNRRYPDPDYEHNSFDVPWAPDEVHDVRDRVDRVRVPRQPAFGEPARLVVEEGQHVDVGDTLGHPAGRWSVGLHASIEGEVTDITDGYVEIQA